MDRNRVTSQYDEQRNLTVGSRHHRGIDIAPNRGLPGNERDLNIYAAADGVVFEVNTQDDTGLMVKIHHEDGDITTRYLHLDSATVEPGQRVSVGDHIGTMGNSGRSTATHLHFDVLEGRQSRGTPRHYLNPNDFLPRPTPPPDTNTMPAAPQLRWL